MTTADKPGYVYGVAVHSSRVEEGTPDCSCACHRANQPGGAKGWWCDNCHSYIMCCSWPKQDPVDYSHEQAIADGTKNPKPYMVPVPDYYFITRGNSLDDAFPRRHFKTREAAEKAVKKLNDEDAIASLNVPPSHQQRFDRFRELHGDHYFGWWDWDSGHHPLTRLPATPDKYAVETYYDGGLSWSTCETLEEVRDEIADGDVERVVDLDTGEDVPFRVNVEIGAA